MVEFDKTERIQSLMFTSLGHFTNDFTILLFSILITYYNADFGIGLAALGGIAIIYNLISGFLSTQIGKYADSTKTYRKAMTLGIVALGASVILFAISFFSNGNIILFMVMAIILLGIGQAFYHPLGASILNLTYGEKSASALGINGSLGSVGRSLLPLILIPLIIIVGKFMALTVIGICIIAAGIIIYAGLSFLKVYEVKKDERHYNAIKNKEIISKYRPVLLLIVAMVFMRAMLLIGSTTYISAYILSQVKSEVIMSYILTISFVSAVIGQPIFGKLTDMYGGKTTVGITTAFSTLFFILFMLSGSNTLLITATYTAFVFFAFTGFPVLLGYINQIVPREVATTAHGMVWGIGNTIGGAFGIAVMAFMLFLNINLGVTMWFMAIFGIISVLFIPFIPGKKASAELRSLGY